MLLMNAQASFENKEGCQRGDRESVSGCDSGCDRGCVRWCIAVSSINAQASFEQIEKGRGSVSRFFRGDVRWCSAVFSMTTQASFGNEGEGLGECVPYGRQQSPRLPTHERVCHVYMCT